ncbi:hypothetical protein COCON_G00080150, partial [Conger conger]
LPLTSLSANDGLERLHVSEKGSAPVNTLRTARIQPCFLHSHRNECSQMECDRATLRFNCNPDLLKSSARAVSQQQRYCNRLLRARSTLSLRLALQVLSPTVASGRHPALAWTRLQETIFYSEAFETQ